MLRLAVLIVVLTATAAAAQTPELRGASLGQFLERLGTVATSVPGAADELRRARESVVVVFLPGVLGSTLALTPSGTVIWGDGQPSFEALLLPPAQLAPDAAPAVAATVMATFRGVPGPHPDVYAPVLGSLGRAAKSAGAIFAPIGYDWRRDITASVRQLDVELRRDHPGRSLILVGHSMGGLVAWQWAAQHGGGADGGPRARHLVLVGSPVAGSCEMFRVLSDGYTAPTVHPDYATAFGRLMKPITDTALKWFTTDA